MSLFFFPGGGQKERTLTVGDKKMFWTDRALKLKAQTTKFIQIAWRRGGRAAWVVIGA